MNKIPNVRTTAPQPIHTCIGIQYSDIYISTAESNEPFNFPESHRKDQQKQRATEGEDEGDRRPRERHAQAAEEHREDTGADRVHLGGEGRAGNGESEAARQAAAEDGEAESAEGGGVQVEQVPRSDAVAAVHAREQHKVRADTARHRDKADSERAGERHGEAERARVPGGALPEDGARCAGRRSNGHWEPSVRSAELLQVREAAGQSVREADAHAEQLPQDALHAAQPEEQPRAADMRPRGGDAEAP